MKYKPGLDSFLLDDYRRFRGMRLGLVTNHTGLSVNLRSGIDLFYEHPEINLCKIFAPEHGVRGNAGAGEEVDNVKDPYTGLSVYSLYGKTKKPSPEMLKDIDCLIFDIQDAGVRFYTYISTLFYCLESCAENQIPLIVLDRLNPLGRKVEGGIVREDFRSFVGLYPLPVMHGMTPGELAFWANKEMEIGAELEVIELQGWSGEIFSALDLPWIPPSPGLPHFTTLMVYPVTCFFEGTNLSEGRGTTKPFEYIGAPWIDPYLLADFLNKKDLEGVRFRPVFFRPRYSNYSGEECGGVHIIVDDFFRLNVVLTGITILQSILEIYPDKVEWLKWEGEKRFTVDLLLGTDEVRKKLQEGTLPKDIAASWEEEVNNFTLLRREYLLY